MDLRIDVNDLTLGEVEVFEELSGQSIEDLMGGSITTKALLALITVTQRRENPDYSMDDARRVKISELEMRDVDPTEQAAPSQSGRRSRTGSASGRTSSAA